MTSSTLAPFEVSCPSCHTLFPVDPQRIPTGGVPAICSTCMRTFPVSLPEELARARTTEEELTTPAARPRRPAADAPRVADAPAEIDAPPEPEAPAASAGPEAPAAPAEIDAPHVADPLGESPPKPPPAEPTRTPAPKPPPDPTREPDREPAPPSEVTPTAAEAGPGITAEPPPDPAELQDLSSLTDEALSEEPEPSPGERASLSLGAARFGRRDPHERARRLARVLVSDIIAYYPEKHAQAVEQGRVKETFEEEVQKSWKEFVDQVGSDIAESTDYFRTALNEVLARGREIY